MIERLCKRPACGNVLELRWAWEVRRRKFCSKSCALRHRHRIGNIGRLAGARSGKRRRAKMMDRVHGMSPEDAFALGYKRGLQAKHRARKHGA